MNISKFSIIEVVLRCWQVTNYVLYSVCLHLHPVLPVIQSQSKVRSSYKNSSSMECGGRSNCYWLSNHVIYILKNARPYSLCKWSLLSQVCVGSNPLPLPLASLWQMGRLFSFLQCLIYEIKSMCPHLCPKDCPFHWYALILALVLVSRII
jgi:hypothetical protein